MSSNINNENWKLTESLVKSLAGILVNIGRILYDYGEALILEEDPPPPPEKLFEITKFELVKVPTAAYVEFYHELSDFVGVVDDITYEVYGESTQSEFPNKGDVLDLDKFSGQTVSVTCRVKGRYLKQEHTTSKSIEIKVPSWDKVIGPTSSLLSVFNQLKTKPESMKWKVILAGEIKSTSQYLGNKNNILFQGTETLRIDGKKETPQSAGLLRFHDCKNITFSNVNIENFYVMGLYFSGNTSKVLIDKTGVKKGWGRGIHWDSSAGNGDLHITDSEFSENEVIPDSSNWSGSKRGFGILVNRCSKLRIYNTMTCKNGTDGVTIDSSKDIVIRGHNSNENLRQGILSIHSSDVKITDTVCDENDSTGIQIEATSNYTSENVIIDGCECNNNNQHRSEAQIWIDGSKNVLVQNSTLTGGNNGLYIGARCDKVVARQLTSSKNDGPENPQYQKEGGFAIHINENCQNIAVYNVTALENGNGKANMPAALMNGAGLYIQNLEGKSSNINIQNCVIANCVQSEVNTNRQVTIRGSIDCITTLDGNWYNDETLQNPSSNIYWAKDRGMSRQEYLSSTGFDVNTIFETYTEEKAKGRGSALAGITNKAGSVIEVDYGPYFYKGDTLEVRGELYTILELDGDRAILNREFEGEIGNLVYLHDPLVGTLKDIGRQK